jgi:hypothetical protein
MSAARCHAPVLLACAARARVRSYAGPPCKPSHKAMAAARPPCSDPLAGGCRAAAAAAARGFAAHSQQQSSGLPKSVCLHSIHLENYLACDFCMVIHLTIERPTQRSFVHVGRERSQRFSFNSPDTFLVSIDRPSWSSIESEILFLVKAAGQDQARRMGKRRHEDLRNR